MNIIYLLATTVIYLRYSQACMNITDYFGTLDSSLEMMSYSMIDTTTTSCYCCAMCHKNSGCKSFSFDTVTQQCKLYNKVGSYASFTRQEQAEQTSQFFFMPLSSLTNEFCRSSKDCVTPGDTCRGRICTSNTTVTCRDLYTLNAALPDHRYWGVIEGQQQVLFCRMQAGFEGATLLLAFQHGAEVPWSYENLRYKPSGAPDESHDYSILKYADIIRDHRTASDYRVWIIGKSSSYGDFQQNMTASRTLSLLGSERIFLSSGLYTSVPEVIYDDRFLVFPHITANCHALYSSGNYDCNNRRSIVRTDGEPWWPTGSQARSSMIMYITE